MSDGDVASGLVIYVRLDVLDERAGAIHVQNLQTVADSEDWLAHVVGVLQKQFVHGVARGVGLFGLFVLWLVVFRGINVGGAAGEQDGLAGVN